MYFIIGAVVVVVGVVFLLLYRWALSPMMEKEHLHQTMFREAFGVPLPAPESPEHERVQGIVNDLLTWKAMLLRGLYDAENDGGDKSIAAMRVAKFVLEEKGSELSFYRLSAIAKREGFKTLHDWELYTEGKVPE